MGVSCRMLPLQMPRAGRRHAISRWAELTLYHSWHRSSQPPKLQEEPLEATLRKAKRKADT
jgi:hypothetical protein